MSELKKTAEVIEEAVGRGDAALLAYLPLGFPTVEKSVEAAHILLDEGVDAIELGFPYSDPGMDGPLIQAANVAAIEAGVHLEDYFAAVKELSDRGASVIMMTYWNPIHWYGVDRFAKEFAAAGGSGLITPDLPPEEAGDWIEASEKYGLERVFLVAPSSSKERLALISGASVGWVYAASTMGVTGERAAVDAAAEALVQRTRDNGAELVCVGLGVSTGEQAAGIGSYADGVIVGSAFVRALSKPDWDEAKESLANLARDLKAGVTGAKSVDPA